MTETSKLCPRERYRWVMRQCYTLTKPAGGRELGRIWAVYLPWYQSTCVSGFNYILAGLGQATSAKSSMDFSYWKQICLGVC